MQPHGYTGGVFLGRKKGEGSKEKEYSFSFLLSPFFLFDPSPLGNFSVSFYY